MGWNAGKAAQLQGREARAKARADHADLRARTTEAVREQRRRQAEALERIRAAAAGADPEPEPGADPEPAAEDCRECGRPLGPDDTGTLHDACRKRIELVMAGGNAQPSPSNTEGNTMSGDTTYTQQMSELQAIRRDAEEEVNSVRRKRMVSRLDILQSLGLDKNTLSEAADIDDALQAQEKAAQQTLDATDAAIHGLKQRHGGIKEAVDDAPVDKPAEPEFYQD
jgi:hypothetical protein